MAKITRDSLLTLEAYSRIRNEFRTKVIAHKKVRTVHLGENLTLIFEDELTMRYQIQEMLRAEKVFEEAGIEDEMGAYNPLVPDGTNWKATMMVEYAEIEERRQMLAKLIGVEDKVWVQVAGCARSYAIADEDLERETEEKTSSVHFLRFELDADSCQAVKAGAKISVGVDHPNYSFTLDALAPAVQASLAGDITA